MVALLVWCVGAVGPRPLEADVRAVLPGTEPLAVEGDLASDMVTGLDRFLLRETAAAAASRAELWRRDFTSPAAYDTSVASNRARLARAIGAGDSRVAPVAMERFEPVVSGGGQRRTGELTVEAVRWPVLRGIWGEGILLRPVSGRPIAFCIAIPDADQAPELVSGLDPGLAPEHQFARRLAASGCAVLVPFLIDRADTRSITRAGRATNQPHREFVYRPAFEMGRHIIGYEVQKVLAAVDWAAAIWPEGQIPTGVFGYGEGGLLALYAGGLDTRIAAVAVSGYFGPREALWQEPIYRNVFGLLAEFGDAELASLIAPRALVVEASGVPPVAGPPAPREGRSGAAPGRIAQPSLAEVEAELVRARGLVAGLVPEAAPSLVASGAAGLGPPGSEAALAGLVGALVPGAAVAPPSRAPLGELAPLPVDRDERQRRQLDQLLEDTQVLMRESPQHRRALWARADDSFVAAWEQSVAEYREHFGRDIIGRFAQPRLAPRPRARLVYDEPAYRGYEVVLDVFPDVFAYGLLLVPNGIAPGDRRPVVVCQHGLEGRPQEVAAPGSDHPAYHRFAGRLAERGFITYAPQNPYIFGDRFRTLQRKANPLGKSLFSLIVAQHETTVEWLAGLPMVDPERIAFYGLSYGGKTAMRVPALVPRYCLAICSADFNEWIWKNAALDDPHSYVGTGEYEIFEFDLGNTYNYAEMAGLIAPRPFMVERGHHDGVAPDEWVAYEYAKVRLLYTKLGIADRTEIEFFDGPHTIHGVGTFAFLHKHLGWPAP